MKKQTHLTRTLSVARKSLYLAMAAASPMMVGQAYAGPEGGQVVGGAGAIDQSGFNTTINQHTDRMAIDWQSFNVNADERVQFIQPGASSVALNRVLSHQGSEIHGRIDANGHVVLVNPNGVFFGENSQVNVGGLIASGLSIDPADFMNGDFTLTALEGTDGKVVNTGIINAATGGSVALIGQQVQNDGLISARLGAVNLAAGKEAVVTFDAGGLLGVRVSQEILQDELGVDAAVINNGEINAEGGRILLTASTSQDIFSQAVNSGELGKATSVVMHEDGSFTLGGGADVVNSGGLNVSSDTQGAGQIVAIGENVTSSGRIHADSATSDGGQVELHARATALLTQASTTSARASGAKGGDIKLLGHHVGLFDQAVVDASGASGGGQVLIGGDFQGKNAAIRNAERTFVGTDASIYANAFEQGDAGRVIVWADDITRYYGSIFANSAVGKGGFAEVSGKSFLDFNGVAELKGLTDWGTLLLDPENISITSDGGSQTTLDNPVLAFDDDSGDDISLRADAIERALRDADVVLEATDSIAVSEAIAPGTGPNSFPATNANSLTLSAGNSISIRADIDLGAGDLIFNAGVGDCGTETCVSPPVNTFRSFTLNSSVRLNTNGDIFINAADNVVINGLIGNADNRDLNSLEIRAGNDITVASTASITAERNSAPANPTILLSAGDASLFDGGDGLFAEATGTVTGDILFSGELETDGGDIRFDASGDVTLARALDFDDFGEVLFEIRADGDININANIFDSRDDGNDSLDLDFRADFDNSVSGTFTLADGIDIYTGGGNFLASGQGIQLNGQTINTDFAEAGNDSDNSTGGNITLASSTSFVLGRIITDTDCGADCGHFTLEARNTGDGLTVTQSAAATVQGRTILDLGTAGSATLNNASNALRDALEVISAFDVNVRNNQRIILSNSTVIGDLTLLAAAGGIGQFSAVDVTGTTTLTAQGADQTIQLDSDSNDFNGAVSATTAGGAITISDNTGFNLGTMNSGGGEVTLNANLNLASAGSINAGAGDIDIDGNVTSATGQTITLGANDLTITGAVGTNTNYVGMGITANGIVDLNAVYATDFSATGNSRFTAGNITTQSGAVTIASSGPITVEDIVTVGDGTLPGGAVTITGSGTNQQINLNGDINAGIEAVSVNLSSAGTVTLGHNAFFTSDVTVNGSIGQDTLTGFNLPTTWTTNAANAGELVSSAGTGGAISFSNIEVLNGGSGIDRFNLGHDISSSVNGGGGADVFTLSASVAGLLNGGSGNDNFTVTSDLINATISGGDNTDILTGFNGTNRWIINQGANASNPNRLNFSGTESSPTPDTGVRFYGVENAAGSEGDFVDTFTVNGNLDIAADGGGGENDLVNVSGNIAIDFSNIDAVFNGIARVEAIGNSSVGGGVLTANSAAGSNVNWLIYDYDGADVPVATSSNSGVLTSGTASIKFTNFSSLVGGAGNDLFRFTENSLVTGTVNGGTGSNQLDVSDLSNTNAYRVALGGSVTGANLNVSNVNSLLANTLADHTLMVASAGANTWSIFATAAAQADGTNDGRVSSDALGGQVSFVNFANLRGGQGNDTFNFAFTDSGVITGSIDGFDGDDTLQGRNAANLWTLANDRSRISVDDIDYLGSFSDFETLQGGNLADTFSVNVAFNGDLLGGDGDDLFAFGASGSALNGVQGQGGTNDVLRGRNSMSSWRISNGQVIDLSSGNSMYIGGFDGVEVLQGGSSSDTFEIDAAFAGRINGGGENDVFNIYNNGSASLLDGGDNGASGGDRLDLSNLNSGTSRQVGVGANTTTDINIVNMELALAAADANHILVASGATDNAWTITAANTGSLNFLNFSNFANLRGGALVDTFTFSGNTAAITGFINGGNGVDTANMTGIGRDISVRLIQAENDLVAGNIHLMGVETLSANGNFVNRLLAGNTPNSWLISTVNGGSLNATETSPGTVFSGFKRLVGGNDDDNFAFRGAGAVDHVDGGAQALYDTVDLSQAESANVILAELDNDGYSNIERYSGNGTTSSVTGNNDNNIWTLGAGINTFTINSGAVVFTGFAAMIGGSGDDTFNLNQGELTGSVSGGVGDDNFNIGGGALVGGPINGGNGNDTLAVTLLDGVMDDLIFNGGANTNVLTIGGQVSGYSAVHAANGVASGELRYTQTTGNTYTLGYTGVGTVNDNVVADSLTVQGTGNADTFTLTNNRYLLNDFATINYTNKSNLNIAAQAGDSVVIAADINIPQQFAVQNASLTTQAGVIRAGTLRLDGTAAVGSAGNRLQTSVNNLSVASAAGDIYLAESNSVNISEFVSNSRFDLQAADDVSSAVALASSGNFNIAAGGGINLTADNSLIGPLGFAAGGNIDFRNISATNLANVNAQTLSINSTGAITSQGPIIVNGATNLSSNGNIELTNLANDFNSVQIGSATGVTLVDVNNLALTSVTSSGVVKTTSQGLAVNGVVNVADLDINAQQGAAILGNAVTATNGVKVVAQGITLGNSLTASTIALDGTGGVVNINGAISTAGKQDIAISGERITQSADLIAGTSLTLTSNTGVSMEGAARITAETGSVSINALGDISARAITASANVDLTAGTGVQVNQEIISTAGNININGAGNLLVGANLNGFTGINLQSANGGLQQQAALSSPGDIIVNVLGDITMDGAATSQSTAAGISYTGANLNIAAFTAEAGAVTLKANTGAVVDANGGTANVTAQRLVVDAESGIGSGDELETMISELSLSNNTGSVGINNGQELLIDRLRSNMDVSLTNTFGDLTFAGPSGEYLNGGVDAREVGGVGNVNYNVGNLFLTILEGDLLAAGIGDVSIPDITARTLTTLTPLGGFGAADRPLVVYVKDLLVIGGLSSWGPIWGFDARPADVQNTATLQADMSDILASGNEQLIEVESLDDIDPAIFTSVRNYFYDDISIRMPADQLFDSEDDEEEGE